MRGLGVAQEKQTLILVSVSRERCGFGGEFGNKGGDLLAGLKPQAFVLRGLKTRASACNPEFFTPAWQQMAQKG